MRNIFIAILILSLSLASQTILSENFSDFRRTTALNLWIPDSTTNTPTLDFGSTPKNLTEVGNIVYTSNSSLKSGGRTSTGYSASSYFKTAESNHVSTPFSLSVWFRRNDATNPGKDMALINNRNGTSLNNWGISYHNASGEMRFFIFIGGTFYKVAPTQTGSAFWNAFFDGNWHNIVGVHDGSTIEVYLDGVKSTNSTAAVGSANTANEEIAIGQLLGFLTDSWDGDIGQIAILDTNLSANMVREEYALMPGWVSKNGNVTRESFAFAQTFWDTIGVPLSDATLGNNQIWQLSYKGKSSDATKTIKAWIGSSASAKSSVYTVTAGTAFATHTVNFGDGFALSSDTLWFASASTADTVSVDDVVLSKTYLSGKKINSWSKH